MNCVVPRWRCIKEHLQKLASRDLKAPIKQVLDGDESVRNARKTKATITNWQERYNRQVTDYHIAAFYLDPATTSKPLEEEHKRVL